jgi:phosphoribosyl-ATP pyrophosphohydrolase
MAKKLAEEAIEVAIDAVNGKTDAVVRESADLFYNLAVLWAAAGVRPEDVRDGPPRAYVRDCGEIAKGCSQTGRAA